MLLQPTRVGLLARTERDWRAETVPLFQLRKRCQVLSRSSEGVKEDARSEFDLGCDVEQPRTCSSTPRVSCLISSVIMICSSYPSSSACHRRYKEAERAYKEAIKLDALNVHAYTSLGMLAHEEGNVRVAIERYHLVSPHISIPPKYPIESRDRFPGSFYQSSRRHSHLPPRTLSPRTSRLGRVRFPRSSRPIEAG